MAISLAGARFEAVAAGDLFQAHMAYRSPWITIGHSFAKCPLCFFAVRVAADGSKVTATAAATNPLT